jgi:hypothetical protein
MKRLPLPGLFLGLACGLLYAQIDVSGQAEISLQMLPVLPYTADRFDSPVNPANAGGIHDVNLDMAVTFKLDAGGEAGTLTLWLAVDPYDMAGLLLAAAAGDSLQGQAVAESLPVSDPAALSILRANIAWYIGQALVLRVGRQSMLTGYGYGWNPMDFTNPVKDPFDPKAELRGVDALSVLVYLGNLLSLKLAALLRPGDFTGGMDFGQLQGAAELSASLPALEVKLSGYYDHDSARGEDAYVPALGAGFMADLAGAGFYGEAALLWGSRAWFAKDSLSVERKQGLLFSGLLGIQYTFASELSLITEYFHNGEGYSRPQRRLYREGLEAYAPDIPGEYLSMYRPGYFARHYLLLNLGYPLYALKANAELTACFSPDSLALAVMPALEIEVSGSLSVRASYMALASLGENRYDEASLSPARHIVEFRLTHFY